MDDKQFVMTSIPLRQLNAMISVAVRDAVKEHQSKTVEEQKETDQLLTVKEAADFLGITVATIYSKKSRGELPVCKPPGSKRLFFSKKALTEYVLAGRQKSNNEIEAEADSYLKKKGLKDE